MKAQNPYQLWGKETPKGWDSVVDPLIKQLVGMGCNIAQVKEKFGDLRVYIDEGYTSEAGHLVSEATEKCSTTCAKCGAPDSQIRSGGWLVVLCDACESERKPHA